MRVLVTERLAESGIELLRREFEVDVLLGLSPGELVEKIGEYDGLIVRSATKVTAEVIEAAGRLKAIGRAGIGVDNIDIEAATKRGILVANAPESNTVAAAEHTLGLMLAVARRIPAADASLRRGEWNRSAFKGVEVAEKTLGLVGLGHVGSIVARGALGMGMRVLAYDPYVSEERMRSMNVERAASLEEVLEEADFVSLHVPRTPQTTGMVDEEALARMKPTAYLINVARGGIVDETALYNALKQGEIAGAALDVFAEEPTTESPLFTLPNVVVTPHLGASTAEAQDRAGVTAAEQVAAALRGEVPVHAINAPVPAGEGAEFVSQFAGLCETLGRLLYQLTDRPGSHLRIEYRGEIGAYDTRLLDVSVQKGLLTRMVHEPLNYVNTPILAKERGLKVETSKTSESSDYTNLVVARIESNGGESVVSGTLTGPRMQPRLVEALGHTLDIVPERHMLFIRNRDVPGMIGKVGTILGEHGINIGNMAVGRGEPGSRAAMAVTVDEPVPQEVIENLLKIPGFEDARAVTLY
ncbi:D-3-phosphoglycerate dehydrogenase [Rubrobacter xylanophilus]|uniref:D-3-phosphoglycerate dehydrogenase n=1 Tax=Rubrobacter xylanophilus TaxID=49319 RepID=A0A510HE97_9ACTN|nr:phosphoglycerate dehydrogenase [Rubrobacter xylanophilus]BBL78262.1 D-3-phosphoglycerate dehydrogenase [Rubrobacter xylanophilus]